MAGPISLIAVGRSLGAKISVAALAATFLLVTLPARVSAATITQGTGTAMCASTWQGQTFVATGDGPLNSIAVTFALRGTGIGTTRMRIYDTSSRTTLLGTSDNTVTDSSSGEFSSVNAVFTFDSAAITLTNGSSYYFEVQETSTPNQTFYLWEYYATPPADLYTGGRLYEGSGACNPASYNWDAKFTITYNAVDVTAPTLSSSTPADNATGVSASANIVLNFSETVTAVAAKNIVIKRSADDSTFESIPATDARVTISGSTVTVNPTGTFASGTGYYVTIDSGAFKDAASNNYAGISSSTALNFTTADTDPPTLSSSTPADNASGVSLTANIVLDFSETVTAVAAKNIVIKRSADDSTFESIPATDGRVTVSGSTATVNPTGTFGYSTGYYVTIDAGAFRDAASNNYAGISSSTALNFTTLADVVAPTLSSSSPADNDTGVSVTPVITLTFSESVTGAAGKSVLVKRSSSNATVETISATDGSKVSVSGATVTLTPSSTLSYATGYYLTVDAGAFEDSAGNPYAGISSSTALNFTTSSDSTAPTLSTSSPADNATGVSATANIVLTFSEDVAAVSGKTITVKKSSDNSTFETVTVTDATRVSVAGAVVTVNLANQLGYLTGYYVTVASGAFEDLAGNPYAGISSSTALNFTTGADVTAPTLSSSTPADNATGVALSTGIVLIFSEPVSAVSGKTIKVVKSSGPATVASFTVTDATKVSVSGAVVTLASVAGLENGTGYHVTIDAGAFEDAAGNGYGGISSSTALNFTTVAAAATTTTAAPTQSTAGTVPPAVSGATTTTVKGTTATTAAVTTATIGTATTTIAPTTTTTVPAVTTTTIPAPDAPSVGSGEAAALVNGESVPMTYTRENNAVTASGAGVSMQVSVLGPDGQTVPLTADGSIELGPDRSIAVSLTGLRPGSDVELWVFSTPIYLGRAVADGMGRMDATFKVPAGLASGKHRLVAKAKNNGNSEVTVALGLVVPDTSSRKVPVSTIILTVLALAAVAALVIPASRRRRRTA